MKAYAYVVSFCLLILVSFKFQSLLAHADSTMEGLLIDRMHTKGKLVVYVPKDRSRVFAYSAVTGHSWKLELTEMSMVGEPIVSENIALVTTETGVFAFGSKDSKWTKLPESQNPNGIRVVNDIAQVSIGDEVWFFSNESGRWTGVTSEGYPYEIEMTIGQ